MKFVNPREELEVYDYWGMKVQDERGKIRIAREETRREERLAIAQRMLQEGFELFLRIQQKFNGETMLEGVVLKLPL